MGSARFRLSGYYFAKLAPPVVHLGTHNPFDIVGGAPIGVAVGDVSLIVVGVEEGARRAVRMGASNAV